jgi:hypothetical protein
MNTNPNKGGEYVSFYLEYEYESELGRVSHCVCMCKGVDMYHNSVELVLHHCQELKIRFQMITNISEMLIGQLQVTQRD